MSVAVFLLAALVLVGVGLFVLDSIRRYDDGGPLGDYIGRHRSKDDEHARIG